MNRPVPGDPDFPYMLADTPEEFERVRRGQGDLAHRIEAMAARLDHYVAMRRWAEPGSHDDGINKAYAAVAADLRLLIDRQGQP